MLEQSLHKHINSVHFGRIFMNVPWKNWLLSSYLCCHGNNIDTRNIKRTQIDDPPVMLPCCEIRLGLPLNALILLSVLKWIPSYQFYCICCLYLKTPMGTCPNFHISRILRLRAFMWFQPLGFIPNFKVFASLYWPKWVCMTHLPPDPMVNSTRVWKLLLGTVIDQSQINRSVTELPIFHTSVLSSVFFLLAVDLSCSR